MMIKNINLANLTSNTGISVILGSTIANISVSNAGDVNGDGYSDVLIGQTTNNAYLIFGGSNLPDITPANLFSLNYGAAFAQIYSASGGPAIFDVIPVAGAGDVNNDGYADMIVGIPNIAQMCYGGNLNYYQYYGISFISYGGPNIVGTTLSENILITDPTTCNYPTFSNTALGYSVSGIGDFNKDGYSDVAISSKDNSNVYIIFGDSTLNNINVNSLTSSQGFTISTDYKATQVSGIGDINNDGYADIIIGASSATPSLKSQAGISYVIYGVANSSTQYSSLSTSTLTSSQGFSISGAYSYDNSGYSVAKAGDVNGDGYADIIIGAPIVTSSYSTTFKSAAYIIYGGVNLTNINLASLKPSQGISIISSSYADQFGYSVSSAGDFNKDGYADMIVGAPLTNVTIERGTLTNAGAAYIIFGGASLSNINLADLDSSQIITLASNNNNDKLGVSVSGGGDINGDGYNDVIIGTALGASYIVYGYEEELMTPTTIPSVSPTNSPTMIPTTPPTSLPSILPTSSPSISPTSLPSILPTSLPSILPTNSPFALPTSVPSQSTTFIPTFAPTQAIDITIGGIYNATFYNKNFIVNCTSDITFVGGSSSNMYTIKPHGDMTVTITNFNTTSDKINLKAYNIYQYNEINITAGSIIITLEENQKIKLLNLNPVDINSENFILNTYPTSEPTLMPTPTNPISESNSHILSNGAIAGIAASGTTFLSGVVYMIYSKLNNLWPFNALSKIVANPNNIQYVIDTAQDHVTETGIEMIGIAEELANV